MSDSPAFASGLTVDGIAVPQEIESDGTAAVESYVAAQQAVASLIAVSTEPNPPTTDEGVES